MWRLFIDDKAEQTQLNDTVQDVAPDRATLQALHRTIQKVTEDLDGMRFKNVGRHRMRGLPDEVALFQIAAEGLVARFAPTRTSLRH